VQLAEELVEQVPFDRSVAVAVLSPLAIAARADTQFAVGGEGPHPAHGGQAVVLDVSIEV
jgi:hypothetical protein